MKAAAKVAGVDLPDDLDLPAVLDNVADMRVELRHTVNSLNELTGLMRTLVEIEARRAEHEGVQVADIVFRCNDCLTPVSVIEDYCENCESSRKFQKRDAS